MGLVALGGLIAWLIVPSPPKYHRTTFFEFALPQNWGCEQEGSETVCTSLQAEKQAIIIFAAKLRNQQDTLEDYHAYLSRPKTFISPEGEQLTSAVLKLSQPMIAGINWVDSTHYQSELTHYHTRYLAANTAQLGVLITFSYAQDAPQSVITAFEESIEALRVYQQNN